MDKIQGKEGKGVQGSGFTGSTGSNSIGSLPKSSNAALGIDASVAAGFSEAATTPNTKGLNVGDSTSSTPDQDTMSNAKFGIGDDIAAGTVPSRRADDFVNKGKIAPRFGVSALSGGAKMLSQDEILGSGSRKEGTMATFGDPGRGGSMAMAIRGLSGSTKGPGATGASQPSEGAQKDLALAEKGINGTGGPQ